MRDISRRGKLEWLGGPLLLAAGLLIILYSTLKPFDFQFRRLTVGDYIAGFDIPSSSFLDFPRNLLLFMPLGFGLASILDRRGWSKRQIRLTVLAAGFLLTLFVETMQHFLVDRQPSVGDLIANSLGALAGLALYRFRQSRKLTAGWKIDSVIVPRNVGAGLAIYVLLLPALAYGLASAPRLENWNGRYRILLGNERTGDRPWSGSVRDVVIYNQALDINEARSLLTSSADLDLAAHDGLLAYYPLTGSGREPDLTGNQPDLLWQPAGEIGAGQKAGEFDGERWLESAQPVRDLSKQMQETSQLSLRLSVATADLEQKGPARILSISEDPYHRNLTIGQEGRDLILRFRSSLTGANGTRPQILFPDFFESSDPVDLLVTFDGLEIALFDSRSKNIQSIEMVPGVVFFYTFLHPLVGEEMTLGQVPVGAIGNWGFRLLFYALVFLPVGVLLWLPVVKTWPGSYRLIPAAIGLFVMPLLLESILVYRSGLGLRPLNLATSMLVMMFIARVFMPTMHLLFGRSETADSN